MVRWATRRRRASGGEAAPRSATDGGAGRRGGALGPQARGIFDRLFGSSETAASTQARPEAVSIAVASGKGGTGKSFLTTNLAVLMHRAGDRVAVVDCDFGLACAHLLLGVSPCQTLQDFIAGRCGMAELCMATPAGPTLVPGAQGVRRMAALTDAELLRFGTGLGELAAMQDTVLLDVGAGIAPQAVLTMLAADHLVLVTEAEIAALTDAYAVIKCLAQLRDRVEFSVMVNRVAAPGQGRLTFDKLADVSRRFTGVTLRYLGEVGFDPAVTHRRLGQQPMVVTEPEGRTAAALGRVYQRLVDGVGPLAPRQVTADDGIEARFRSHRVFLT